MFAGGAGEGGFVGDGALVGAAGEGVVENGANHGGVGNVADVIPAAGEVGSGGGGGSRVGGVLGAGRAGETDAGEARGGGKDDAARVVVPGVRPVLESAGRRSPPYELRTASNHAATNAASPFNSSRISVGTSLPCIALMMPAAVTLTP